MTKRTRRRPPQDQFTLRRQHDAKKVQIISHGRPISHIVITDERGGAVRVDVDLLPSMQEVLEHISLVNNSLAADPNALPN